MRQQDSKVVFAILKSTSVEIFPFFNKKFNMFWILAIWSALLSDVISISTYILVSVNDFILVVAHNRYWAVDTVYARDNGGNYSFIIENQNKVIQKKISFQILF